CFPVPKPKIVALGCANRGIELRRPPLPSSYIRAKRIRATRIVYGTRVRDCDSSRAFGVWSSLFDSKRARPAPRPCGDGSVAGGVSATCRHLSAPNSVLMDCSLYHWAGHVIGPTPLLREPKAENVRTDCQCAVRLVRLEVMPQKALHVAAAMSKEPQRIRQNPYCEIRAAAQRAHSKLQKPPPTPATRERHDGCRDQHEVAGALCSRRDARVQF